jgi:cytosine/adenosine deaminase-related metal-dependent hydrolase
MLTVLLALALLAEPPQIFTNVTVLPMDREGALTDHAVVVADGRIVTVAPSAEIDVPADATAIDGSGKWLMPGLVDMHVHTWVESEHVLFLANGVTTVRNMFGSPTHLTWRAEVESGERLAPTIVTAGPIVDGSPPIWPGSTVVTTPEQAVEVVNAHVEQGYDFVKVYAVLPVEVYAALVEAAEDVGLPVDGHVPNAVGLGGVLVSGQRTLEHLIGYETWLEHPESPVAGRNDWMSRFQAWQHLDEERTPRAVVKTVEAGIWNCPTLVVMQKWLTAEQRELELEQPYMKYVSEPQIGMWKNMTANMTDEVMRAAASGDLARTELVRALHSGGAPILLGTDQGNPWVVAGFSVHQELANLVNAGLTPWEALRAGTRSPAECLEQTDEFGAVAAGLRADLVLLDADPTQDVGNAAKIAGVMVRGRWLPASDLQQRLEATASR